MNTEDFAGQSIAFKASRAMGQAAQANSGPGAKLRAALQRRSRTVPATPRTVDAAATAAPYTLANPTNMAYRRRLSPHPDNPARCQPSALTLHSPCNGRHGGSVQRGLPDAASASRMG